jgi:hypothetical protein
MSLSSVLDAMITGKFLDAYRLRHSTYISEDQPTDGSHSTQYLPRHGETKYFDLGGQHMLHVAYYIIKWESNFICEL